MLFNILIERISDGFKWGLRYLFIYSDWSIFARMLHCTVACSMHFCLSTLNDILPYLQQSSSLFFKWLGQSDLVVEQFGWYTHFDSFRYRFWTIIPILLWSNNMYCLCRMKLNKQNEKILTSSLHICVWLAVFFFYVCLIKLCN